MVPSSHTIVTDSRPLFTGSPVLGERMWWYFCPPSVKKRW